MNGISDSDSSDQSSSDDSSSSSSDSESDSDDNSSTSTSSSSDSTSVVSNTSVKGDNYSKSSLLASVVAMDDDIPSKLANENLETEQSHTIHRKSKRVPIKNILFRDNENVMVEPKPKSNKGTKLVQKDTLTNRKFAATIHDISTSVLMKTAPPALKVSDLS